MVLFPSVRMRLWVRRILGTGRFTVRRTRGMRRFVGRSLGTGRRFRRTLRTRYILRSCCVSRTGLALRMRSAWRPRHIARCRCILARRSFTVRRTRWTWHIALCRRVMRRVFCPRRISIARTRNIVGPGRGRPAVRRRMIRRSRRFRGYDPVAAEFAGLCRRGYRRTSMVL